MYKLIISKLLKKMYFRNMKNYQSMNLVHTTSDGNELWLGDYYAATDLKLLKSKNISSVLTAAAMLNVRYPVDANMNHKTINCFDIPTYKMTPHFQEAYQFIKNALEKGNILVHCAAGISRSTTCVLVYLMREKGFTLKQGIQYVRKKRSIINPNYGFQAELARFEERLKKGVIGGTENVEKNKIQGAFSRKPEKTVQQIQEQKNAFMKFMSKEANPNKTTGTYNTRMMSTAGRKNDKLIANSSLKMEEQRNRVGRGQSLNYRKTMNSNDVMFPSSRINNLTFKLEQPKIVTIKK